MTYLFVIVGALVFFFCYWRWTKRKMEREERVAGFAGKVARCPAIIGQTDTAAGAPCYSNLVTAGVWKRQKRSYDLWDCAICGTGSRWDMDRAPPVLIDWDKPKEPRKPRRPRRQRDDDKHPAILSEGRSTTIRPGEKPSDAVRRLDQGEDL